MEVYRYCGVGLCFTEVVRQARRPLQSCDCHLFLSFATISVNPPPPTSNKLFWSLIALAPHSYDYKTGKMKKIKNREKCEECEDFIHRDNHIILSCPMTSLLSCHFAFCLLIHFPLNALTRHCKRNLPQSSHAAALHQAPAYGQASHL